MKQTDQGVSEVIGSIILIAIVTFFVCGIIAGCMVFVQSGAESAPLVSFKESASPHYLYHAGGDFLQKSDIRVYHQGVDITKHTTINGKSWDVWNPGEALHVTQWYKVYQITIVGRTSSGEPVILYEGIKQGG